MTLPGAFLSLLIAVVGALLVGPLLDTGPRAVIDQALFSAVLIAAVVSVRRQRGQLIAAAAGALAAVGLGWAALVTGDDTIVLAWLLLTVLFLGFVIVSLLGVVFRTRRVVTDTVLGAICIYFLIGYAWGHGFAIIELRRPASFGGLDEAVEPGRLHALIYYSLGTLTTLSAGDIVPLTPPVRTLSVIEAATGQLYLTVLIARLVGLQIAESSER
ncbi:MAG: ion transporter [Candidatus Rokuibacteriota bacterium]|nr:MAG: ion transporter [Candidatus Rokubacteria bacterium]